MRGQWTSQIAEWQLSVTKSSNLLAGEHSYYPAGYRALAVFGD